MVNFRPDFGRRVDLAFAGCLSERAGFLNGFGEVHLQLEIDFVVCLEVDGRPYAANQVAQVVDDAITGRIGDRIVGPGFARGATSER